MIEFCSFLVCLFFGFTRACGILVPWLEMEPVSLVVEVGGANHWTAQGIHSFLNFVS